MFKSQVGVRGQSKGPLGAFVTYFNLSCLLVCLHTYKFLQTRGRSICTFYSLKHITENYTNLSHHHLAIIQFPRQTLAFLKYQ